jgi:dihydroorotate dehydrogenase
MPLLASEKVALDLILKAEEAAKAPYLAKATPENPLSPSEIQEMVKAVREAGLKALFAHIVANTVVNGTGGGPAPVVGIIL